MHEPSAGAAGVCVSGIGRNGCLSYPCALGSAVGVAERRRAKHEGEER